MFSEAPAIWETSGVGDMKADGAAEHAVQALCEEVRVLRLGLERWFGLSG